MKDCEKFKYDLPDFALGKVDLEKKRLLELHLTSCLRCKDELQSLEILLSRLKEDKVWKPSHEYWMNLLPNIHERIDAKKKIPFSFIPSWVTRFVVPAMAAVLLTVFSIQYMPHGKNTIPQNDQTLLQQVPNDELQEYAEQQTVVGEPSAAFISTDKISLIEDRPIIKEILSTESGSLTKSMTEQDALDAVSDQDADAVVSIIQQNSTTLN